MTDPIVFETSTPRFGLPLLFVGQAQKEAFVNEAHALTDALLHCTVEGQVSDPPVDAVDGHAWVVGPAATGEWNGRDDDLALRQGGNWLYVKPLEGMRVFDRSLGQDRRFTGAWTGSVALSEPSGGSTVDAEARAAIHGLVVALRAAGIIPDT